MGVSTGKRHLTPLEKAECEVLFYERRRDELIEELTTNQQNLSYAQANLIHLRAEEEAKAAEKDDVNAQYRGVGR
jgi:hypothetical protein